MTKLLSPADGAHLILHRPEHTAFFKGEFAPDGAHDLDTPVPVPFLWEGDGELILTDGTGAELRFSKAEAEAGISCLKVGEEYRWTVSGVEETRIFTTDGAAPRWIAVPGIANCRDVGGWKTEDGIRVKQGLLFRCSELEPHEHIVPEGKALLIEKLGVRTDIDLRGVFEPCWPVLDTLRVNWKNHQIEAYDKLFQLPSRPGAYDLWHTLANPATYPAILHCWGGMDRTATTALLIQALCGVAEEDLQRDYLMSSFSHGGLRHLEYHEFPDFWKDLMASGETMPERAKNYLVKNGVPEEDADSVRRIFRDGL